MDMPSMGKFDLIQLLKLGDLNVRAIAEKDSLSVKRYFERLDYFLLEAPGFVNVLNDMAIIGNESFFLFKLSSFQNIQPEIDALFTKELQRFNDILSRIGAERLILLVRNLDKYIKAWGDELNAELAAKLSAFNNTHKYENLEYSDLRNELVMIVTYNINDMCARIKKATAWEFSTVNLQAADMSDPNALLLNEAIKQLETEERNRKRRILVIDDMSLVLNVVTTMLKEHYEVHAFTKGDQVLKFLKVYTPDLFLLDIEMPGIDGYTLFKMIKELEEHKDTPIIFLTGNARSEYLETARAIGATDFIKKPVDQKVLLQKIERAFALQKKWY